MIVQPQPCSISPNDILFGRGRSKDLHQGNIAYRNIVRKYKLSYTSKTATSEEKRRYSAMVISEVKAQDPPGRFLRCESGDDEWYEVDDGTVIKKVRQALREDAPSIRRKSNNKNMASDDDFNTTDPSPAAAPQGKRSYKRRKTSQDSSDSGKDNRHKKCLKKDPHDLVKIEPKTEELKTEEEDLQTPKKTLDVRNNKNKNKVSRTGTRTRAKWTQFVASEDRDSDCQCQVVTPNQSLTCLYSFQDDYDDALEEVEEAVLQPLFWDSNKIDLQDEEEGMFFLDHDISPLTATTIVEKIDEQDYFQLMDEILMLGQHH
jgi:hypothetical protein